MCHTREQKNFHACSLAAFRTVMDVHKEGGGGVQCLSRILYSSEINQPFGGLQCTPSPLRRGSCRELRSVPIAALHALESIFIYLYYVYPYYVHAHTFTRVYATFLLEL